MVYLSFEEIEELNAESERIKREEDERRRREEAERRLAASMADVELAESLAPPAYAPPARWWCW